MSKPFFMAAQERPLSSAVLDDENDASQSKHRWSSGLRLPRYVIASITVACAAMLFGYSLYKSLG